MPFINRCGDAPKLQTKTVTPTHTTQTVTPDTGFDAMEKVIIKAPTFQTKTVTTDGTFTPDTGYAGMSSVVVNTPRSAYFTYTATPENKVSSLSFDVGDYWNLHGGPPSSIILFHSQFNPNNPNNNTGDLNVSNDHRNMRAAQLTKYDNNHYIGYVYRVKPSDAEYDADKSGEAVYNPRTTITAADANADKVLVSYNESSKTVTINFTQYDSSKYKFYFIESGASNETQYVSFYYAMFLWGNQNGG